MRFSFIPDCGIGALEYIARHNFAHSGFKGEYFGHALYDSDDGVKLGRFDLAAMPIAYDRQQTGYAKDGRVARLLGRAGLRARETACENIDEFLRSCRDAISAGLAVYCPYISPVDAHGHSNGYQSLALIGVDGDTFQAVAVNGPTTFTKSQLEEALANMLRSVGYIRQVSLEQVDGPASLYPSDEQIAAEILNGTTHFEPARLADHFLVKIQEWARSGAGRLFYTPRIWSILYQRRQQIDYLRGCNTRFGREVLGLTEACLRAWQRAWFLSNYYYTKGVAPNFEKLIPAFEEAFTAEVEFVRGTQTLGIAHST